MVLVVREPAVRLVGSPCYSIVVWIVGCAGWKTLVCKNTPHARGIICAAGFSALSSIATMRWQVVFWPSPSGSFDLLAVVWRLRIYVDWHCAYNRHALETAICDIHTYPSALPSPQRCHSHEFPSSAALSNKPRTVVDKAIASRKH